MGGELSKEALRLRRPLDVLTLLSADPTPIKHIGVRKSRPGRSVKRIKSKEE